MKKINSILQKAALFEKLAIYGDRSSFLRALAQTSPLNSEMKERLDRLMKDISVRKPALADKMLKFYDGTNTNLRELLLIVNEAINLIPKETNAPQRNNAEQLAEMLSGTNDIMNMPEGEPEDIITNQVIKFSPDTKQMTSIPLEVRQKLKELGYYSPINTAAEGQKAMDWFRDKYKIPPAITGNTLYNQIKQEAVPYIGEV
jgi:hypothetical protein